MKLLKGSILFSLLTCTLIVQNAEAGRISVALRILKNAAEILSKERCVIGPVVEGAGAVCVASIPPGASGFCDSFNHMSSYDAQAVATAWQHAKTQLCEDLWSSAHPGQVVPRLVVTSCNADAATQWDATVQACFDTTAIHELLTALF